MIEIVDIKEPFFADKFSDSLKKTGFAVVKPDIDLKPILDDFYREWQIFFSSDTKTRYTHKENSQRGYFPFQSEKAKDKNVFDLKEFYHLYDEADIPFGIDQPTRMLAYYLEALGDELLQALDVAMPKNVSEGLSCPLIDMIKDTEQTLFRVIHYPPILDDVKDDAVRASAHEDINLITLLPAASNPGLQVKTYEMGWYEVPVEPGTIVVNAGDMLQEATNGYYKSTTHQVVNPVGVEARQARLSAPLFIHPRPEVRLSNRYTADEYLKQRLKEIGIL